MVRKTRRHVSKKQTGVFSIPELRRAFEHIEEFVDNKVAQRESKDQIIKDLQKEWSRTFHKDLDKKSADAFVSDRLTKTPSRRKTLRKRGGAAPLDHTTRAGIYLAPGQIPDKAGHLPLSDGGKSNFGSYVQYVNKGFWNPEPGHSYDPVPGQTHYPTAPPAGMGTNTVHFAAKGGKRRTRRGGALTGSLLQQAFNHPIPASAPPGVLQDMQDMWYGKQVGPSSDQVQRGVDYKLGSVYPKAISF
jgi:hypothetical protein